MLEEVHRACYVKFIGATVMYLVVWRAGRGVISVVEVSCGYNTYFPVYACDGLYHLLKYMDRIGTPFGFQSILWTFVRHTVSSCPIFPALPEVN